ncbi:MAG TPA: circularly permuted type 2 ATP-grasp protein [Solirubrobacteraceae bacterium]|nr:circularly permuted type 2 ATP-grasp protein [Solirubrobacteraceae bacterium]
MGVTDRAAGGPLGDGAPVDEGAATGSQGREPDRLLSACLGRRDLEELAVDVRRDTQSRGVCFGSPEQAQEFRIDPVPRLIDALEWHELQVGIAQRVHALERFLLDIYGERRIVDAGVVPVAAIETANHYEPLLQGTGGEIGTWVTVAGLDIVRDSDGAFKALEDNLRTPSGIAYAVAAREIVAARLPPPPGVDVRSLDGALDLLGRGLRAAAPARAGGEPTVILLTDGERNSAYYEHATIARSLGLPLVQVGQLSLRRGRLHARIGDGQRPVDVVYRRTDEDRLTAGDGGPTAIGELLLEPIRRGTLACVNAFGTGVGDDKLIHAYVEEMVRFYLGEEPLLRSVATYDPGDPETLQMILDRLDELVIKPRSGHGGYGVLIGPHARADDIERTAVALRAAPHDYVAQEMVMLSRHPTVVGGTLEPRHIDLRSFAVQAGETVEVLPGGLTRVAFERGALVVNSSQNGGSKDTWVLT